MKPVCGSEGSVTETIDDDDDCGGIVAGLTLDV